MNMSPGRRFKLSSRRVATPHRDGIVLPFEMVGRIAAPLGVPLAMRDGRIDVALVGHSVQT